jgi:hypothetical protein
MGSRDKSHKEAKKQKKDSKKVAPIINPAMPAPPPVEVIKRGKKEKFGE